MGAYNAKRGQSSPLLHYRKNKLSLRFGGVFAASETRGRPQFGPHGFGIHARRRWSLRRRRAGLFRERLAFHEQLYFGGVNDFPFEKSLGYAFENVAVAGKNAAGSIVGRIDDALHFLVNLHGGVFGEIAVLGDFTAKKDGFILFTVSQRPEFAHAPFADHVPSDVRSTLDVVAGAGGDVAQEDFFRGTSAHQHGKHAFEILARVGMLVGFGQLHGEAESHAAWNDRDFVDGIGARSHGGNQRMPRFVVSGVFLFLVGKNHGLALDAHQDFVLRHLKIGHGDKLAVLARSPERRFVDQIRKVRA